MHFRHLVTGAFVALLLSASAHAAQLSGVTSTASPEPKAASLARAAALTNAQREAIIARRDAIREATSSRGGGIAHGLDRSPAIGEVAAQATLVRRNNRNTRAQVLSNTVAEPAAANDADQVLYLGNTYISISPDHGVTWFTDFLPAGPADASVACCDSDVVHHDGLDATFASMLYVNNAVTNGVVRIYVYRGSITGGMDCMYTIDPGGAANNVLPDYPHIAVSNNFVYLTTNNIRNGATWIGAEIRRFNASQMANCQRLDVTTWTYTQSDGQRILTPVENASTTQYFGLNRSSNVFRILRLRESSNLIDLFDRPLSHGSNFVNPDCRGGVGNFDFIERTTSWSIAGFRLRGAVVPGSRLWFVWNSGPDASHPQAHLHSAIFTEPGLSPLASPPVHSSNFCIGYPAIGANSSDQFGLTFAFGGKRGGGGRAAQGAVAVDDASTSGNTFPSFVITATGTHNRSDGRFGDYFTIRRNAGCAHGWVATNYALSGGNTSPAHVNARYVEFQSSLRASCP